MHRAKELLHDRYFLAAVAIGALFSLLVFGYVSQMKQIPAPLYGGDLYYQLGSIYHFYQNGPVAWLDSSSMPGTMPAYLPLYSAAVTIFGKALFLDPIHAMLYFEVPLSFLSFLLFFLLIREWLGSGELALIGAACLAPFNAFPVLKYTGFTMQIIVPLFFLASLLFFKRCDWKSALFLGLSYAAMGLGHGTSFMFASAFVLALFAFVFLREEGTHSKRAKKLASCFALAFVLGFALSLLVWFDPIFKYHGASKLQNNIWGIPDVANFGIGTGLLASQMATSFFNTSSIFRFAISLCSLAGVVFLAAKWRNRKEPEFGFALFSLAVTAIFIYSYFLTAPLFKFHTVPTYSYMMYLAPLLVICGLLFVREQYSKKQGYKYVLAFFLAAFAASSVLAYEGWQANPWIKTGMTALDPFHSSLQAYLLENTQPNDVVLSSNGLSFAINALSGRKAMVSRRSHNSPFMDFDVRQIDAAKIFYGNDNAVRNDLLATYNVKYVYFSPHWYTMEFAFDQQGRVLGYNDPLMVMHSDEYEAELAEYGVDYAVIKGYVDPALRGAEYREYNLTLVTPKNYDFSGYGPWKDEMDSRLEMVWSYDFDGQQKAALYKVK